MEKIRPKVRSDTTALFVGKPNKNMNPIHVIKVFRPPDFDYQIKNYYHYTEVLKTPYP